MSDLVGVVKTLNEDLERTHPATLADSAEAYQRRVNIFKAASVLAGVVEVCPNCEGTGEVDWCKLCKETHRTAPPFIGCTAGAKPCSCRGGVRIKPDAVEKAAKALVEMFASEGGGGVEWPEWSDLFDSEAEMWRDRAEAALLAVLGGEE